MSEETLNASEALVDAFEEDHRVMTQGLARLRELVEQRHRDAAIARARDLDAAAGAHIQFEEEVFYPRLSKLLGAEFVAQLYREHRAGQSALRAILDLEESAGELEGELRSELLAKLDVALEHALSCGTLVSHLETLDEVSQREMLELIERSRAAAPRWSGL